MIEVHEIKNELALRIKRICVQKDVFKSLCQKDRKKKKIIVTSDLNVIVLHPPTHLPHFDGNCG